ncbi:MAG: adenylyl-sulfate kinase [bacterium]
MEIKSTNVVWHQKKVSLEEIEKRNGHKGCVIWLTGLSAAGKSTIAVEAEKQLFDLGCHVCLLDGDNVRQGLNKNLGFSPEDREENIRRIAELSKLLRNSGLIVITAFISPYRKERNLGRSLVEEGHFFETYVKCSLDECINRDPKGLYKKALAGEIKEYTGISAPYEEPVNPELVLDTEILNVDECAKAIIIKLKICGII